MRYMRTTFIVSFGLIIFMLFILFFVSFTKTERTITYFPIDGTKEFSKASTILSFDDETKVLYWKTNSETEDNFYLRQDVSLLFINGRLKGILNAWRQRETTIEQEESLTVDAPSFVQSLTFHHGEWHENDTITSIQQMTKDEGYILDNYLIKKPTKKKEIAHQINETIDEQLHLYWQQLIDFYNLDEQQYKLISFMQLDQFESYLGPDISAVTAARITGQLWEGLYKNYILEAISENSNDYMPVILLANDLSHLYVLFQLQGENKQLRQQIQLEN